MKNIFLISCILLFVSGCDNSNPVTGGDSDGDTLSATCTADGCTATGCAADCACGCEGAGGCACTTNCTCVADESDDDDDGDDDNAVSIANGAFNPSTLTISIGETVTWTLVNGTHSVESDDATWASPSASSQALTEPFSHTFDDAGEFGYKCGIHSSMTGTITVE